MDKLDETLTEFIHQRTPGNWKVIYGWTDSAELGKNLSLSKECEISRMCPIFKL